MCHKYWRKNSKKKKKKESTEKTKKSTENRILQIFELYVSESAISRKIVFNGWSSSLYKIRKFNISKYIISKSIMAAQRRNKIV